MRVAVSSVGTSLDAAVDPRFGRCPYFVIADTDTMQFEAVPNVSQNAPSGTGIQAAQTIAGKGAKAVLTGNIGPNAYQALSAAGIQIVTGVAGTVREAVTKYKDGEFKGVSALATRMGYGMGGGIGRSTMQDYPSVSPVPTVSQMTIEQELEMLRSQMELLQNQLDQVKKRLKELEKK